MTATPQKSLVWLITGASSGLGYELAVQALSRSERVIATSRARSISKLEALKVKGAKVLELDVTAPLDSLKEIAKKAVSIYGMVDVLVNNAGYCCNGTVEETTPEETSDQFNTNFFGAMNVTRAFLPYMRERKTGTVVWISSWYGWTGPPYAGNYVATKWALRGISQSLYHEISPLGLRSISVDFGHFRTAILESDRRAHKGTAVADYEDVVNRMEDLLQVYNGKQPGDPVKGVQAVIDVVRGEGVAEGKAFPADLLLGSDCYNDVLDLTKKNLKVLEKWKDVAYGADFNR